jgi:hypothetical protein
MYASGARRAVAIILSIAFVAAVCAYAAVQLRKAMSRRNDGR